MSTTESANPEGRTSLVEGIDYVVEAGNYVFTAFYLRARGYCCDNGCRNCPYSDTTVTDSHAVVGNCVEAVRTART